MERSINFMCGWCEILHEEVTHYYHLTKSERDGQGAITKEAGDPPADARFSITIRFGKHNSTGSPLCLKISIGTYTLALQCIRDCGSNHARCQSPTREPLPTRIIDCIDPARPRLFITQTAPPDYYVALSYVWGEEQPHRTTKARLSSYTKRIDTECIPETIRDAIKATRSLGLRYLWVDAFCIIQDSSEDKATEISRIRSIFRTAHVTIIAANAERVSKGFLNPRVLYNSPCELPFRCPGGSIGTMFVQPFEQGPKEPVNTRAWCLEERALSARALWYCTHTLQYECQMGHKNVGSSQNMADDRDGFPRLPDRIFTPALPSLPQISAAEAEEEVSKAWRNILVLYSKRTLTESRDLLIALSGVVGYFADFWSNSRYLAGLWEHQLPCCLLWSIGSAAAQRPAKYRAPSWSWAAVDGSITRAVNVYGEVVSGVLVLDVIIRLVVWDPINGEMFEVAGGPGGMPDDSRSERAEIGYVQRDAVEEVSVAKGEVYAAIIAPGTTSILGVVLVPVVTDNVGWFTAPFVDRDVWLNTPRERVQII
ncbi:HET-domain-containing protein [Trichoderma longibrachiatum ATCC 18648]|uniref:HET-domain-containing protein n=1 Tax=Trichoderma longibrachiatum ATCC 18648 TaxID=983965 RepID=A0A2T4C2X3_TRILO|nr:HET-domain-containing protein [Trichoderma longibrachiatum ATCC 18648]